MKRPARHAQGRAFEPHSPHNLTSVPIDAIIGEYLLGLAQAWTAFGGLHPHIEDDLNAVAKALEANATFVQQRGHMVYTIRDRNTRKRTITNVEGLGSLHLGKLDQVCQIRDAVSDYQITPRTAVLQLKELMKSERSGDPPFVQLGLVFCLAATLCVLCRHGSLLDMFGAGIFGVVISIPRFFSIQKHAMHTNLHEYVSRSQSSLHRLDTDWHFQVCSSAFDFFHHPHCQCRIRILNMLFGGGIRRCDEHSTHLYAS
jgi:uncharacterized membrane protein YjjP (DUF1212 family)